jgi:hypothetical protein
MRCQVVHEINQQKSRMVLLFCHIFPNRVQRIKKTSNSIKNFQFNQKTSNSTAL